MTWVVASSTATTVMAIMASIRAAATQGRVNVDAG